MCGRHAGFPLTGPATLIGMTTNELIISLGVLTLMTIGFAVVVWQAAATWRARITAAREEECRSPAPASADHQRETAEILRQIEASVRSLHDYLIDRRAPKTDG
jgi:hypothetical protein